MTWDCYSEEQVSGNLINSSESYNIKVIRLENDAKLLISQSLNKHTFAVYTIGIKFVQVGKQLVGSPYTMFNRDRNLSYICTTVTLLFIVGTVFTRDAPTGY